MDRNSNGMQASGITNCERGDKTKKETSEKDENGVPYDKGWAWMCVLGCFIVNFVVMGALLKSAGVFFTEIVDRYHTDARSTAWVTSIYMAFTLCLGPVMPPMVAKLGLRFMVLSGSALTGCGVLLTAFVTRVEYMYLTYGVMAGIGGGICFNLSMLTVARYFKKRQSLASGLSVAGSSVGSFVLPPLCSILLNNYAFTGAFIVYSAICFHLFLCGPLLRPVEFYTKRKKKTNDEQPISYIQPTQAAIMSKVPMSAEVNDTQNSTHQVAATRFDDTRTSRNVCCHKCCCTFCPRLRNRQRKYTMNKESKKTVQVNIDFKLLKEPQYVIYLVAIILTFAAYPSVFSVIPAHAEELGFSKTQAAFLVSVNGGMDLLGRVIIGFIADLNFFRKSFLYAAALAGTGVCSFLFPVTNKYIFLVVLSGVLGFAVGSFIPLIPPMMVDAFGIERLPGAFGLATFHVGVAMLAGAPVAGLLRDLTGNWNATFYFIGSESILGFLVLMLEVLLIRSQVLMKKDNLNENHSLKGKTFEDGTSGRICFISIRKARESDSPACCTRLDSVVTADVPTRSLVLTNSNHVNDVYFTNAVLNENE